MTERDRQLAAGVPRLIDQYKQRRQAWLAQADELARLRDEVRTAAEREALDIVTAARRDVRRIVVEARRELLALTAQLHAAIESVDQASLQAAAEAGSGADAEGHEATDFVSGQRALGATEDMVLGARREVRTVLDEARAEIEALAAEASRLPDPPIPTLETILGADSSSERGSGAGTVPKVDLELFSIDSLSRTETNRDADGLDSDGDTPLAAWQQSPDSPAANPGATEPRGGGSLTSGAVISPASPARRVDEVASFVVPAVESSTQAGFAREEPPVESVSDLGETGPLPVANQGRTFLADNYRD